MRINRLLSRVALLIVFGSIAVFFLAGCGRNSTDPYRPFRSATEEDDTRLAVYAYTTLSNFMNSVEQTKSLFGINGGVDYSVYRPVGWDTLVVRARPSLSFVWRDTLYIHSYQGSDTTIVKFDQNVGSNIAYRPARITWGEYKYGTLFIGIRGVRLPDSLRNRSIPYDIREFDMMYANNGTDPRYLQGTGAIAGVVQVKVAFTLNGVSITQDQSDTTTGYVTFDNIGSQLHDASVRMHLHANYPYFNPVTDLTSLSSKPLDIDYEITSTGRGVATVTYGGQVRAKLSLLDHQYNYLGNYSIAFDNFQSVRDITY